MGITGLLSNVVDSVRRAGSVVRTGNSAFFDFAEAIAPGREGMKAMHPKISGGGTLINPMADQGSGYMVKISTGDHWINANDVKGKGISLTVGRSTQYQEGYGAGRHWTTRNDVQSRKVFGDASQSDFLSKSQPTSSFDGYQPELKVITSNGKATSVRLAAKSFAEAIADTLPKADQAEFLGKARAAFLKKFPGFGAEWPVASAEAAAAAAKPAGWAP